MQINNEIYQTCDWWSEDAPFDISSLRHCLNPVRYGYFTRTLQKMHLPGKRVLDIGCGGGFLAEEFARDGFVVTGIDPAAHSINAAKRHAATTSLEIDYRIGKGETLPFADGAFDIATCCDALEHVDDYVQVVSEITRILKPGGVFFYDTINRTFISKIVMIKISQEWACTSWAKPNVHVWEKFIKPTELASAMKEVGLENHEMIGIASKKNPFSLLLNLRALKRGKINSHDLSTTFELCETKDLKISYMGYARKR